MMLDGMFVLLCCAHGECHGLMHIVALFNLPRGNDQHEQLCITWLLCIHHKVRHTHRRFDLRIKMAIRRRIENLTFHTRLRGIKCTRAHYTTPRINYQQPDAFVLTATLVGDSPPPLDRFHILLCVGHISSIRVFTFGENVQTPAQRVFNQWLQHREILL